MELVGSAVVYVMMACMVAGAVASMVKPGCELGNQFVEGIGSIGPIFLSVAGIYASIPFITWFIEKSFAPALGIIGSDPAMASTIAIATDMGGYQAADALAATREGWVMATYAGFMSGATIAYSLPIGLRMTEEVDHKYLALGMMCGFVSIPVGMLIASTVTALSSPLIRTTVSSEAEALYQLSFDPAAMLANLTPMAVICFLIAIGLKVAPNAMMRGFMAFGRAIDCAARTVLVLCIIEHFTGLFTALFGEWIFEPLMAYGVYNRETGALTDAYLSQSIEIVGSIGMMLAGAFPMVYFIKTYLAAPLGKIGAHLGLSDRAVAGILATSANTLALFPMIKDMEPLDKVRVLAYCVCGSFIIGDHLSFCAAYQPSLIVPLAIGKLAGGALSIVLVKILAEKRTLELATRDSSPAKAEPHLTNHKKSV